MVRGSESRMLVDWRKQSLDPSLRMRDAITINMQCPTSGLEGT